MAWLCPSAAARAALSIGCLVAASCTARADGAVEPRAERSPAERAAYLERLRDWYADEPGDWPAPTLDAGVEHRELSRLPPMFYPDRNPAGREKEELGKKLFFDPRLSGSGQIACASCHDPDLGWADGRTVSFGHNRRRLARNAPSILNSGYRASLFWDGRSASLEEQAAAVLGNADEMHSGDDVLVQNLAAIPDYVEAFDRLFGVASPGLEQVALAVAAFERTVVSSRGVRFDSFLAGRRTAFSDEELSGLHLFRTEARCLNCHSGPLLTDDKFHAIGLSQYGRRFEDVGRYAVTGDRAEVGAFRTPSLRDVTRTRPYMHSGLFDLDEVLRLYNAGMPTERQDRRPIGGATEGPGGVPPPTKSPLLKPLGLNRQDLADLEAFLGTLEESRARFRTPELPAGL